MLLVSTKVAFKNKVLYMIYDVASIKRLRLLNIQNHFKPILQCLKIN